MTRLFCALSLFSLFLAATPGARAAEGWSCMNGITTPVRVRNGHVECASNDGKNCLWDTCPTLPSGNLKPVYCDNPPAGQRGSDGYGIRNHWCVKVCDSSADCTAGYECLDGISTPIRISRGDVQCASKNGRDCLWNVCKAVGGWHPTASVVSLKPLTCGADSKRKHGTDGYSVADHWCRKACDELSCGK